MKEINWIPIEEIIEEIIDDNPELFVTNERVSDALDKKYDTSEIDIFIKENNISKDDFIKSYYNYISSEDSDNQILNNLVKIFQKIENEQNIPITYFISNIELFYKNIDFLDKFYSKVEVSSDEKKVISKFINKDIIWELMIELNWNILFDNIKFISNTEDDYIEKLKKSLNEYLSIKKIWDALWKKVPSIYFTLQT